jgi:predicted nucleotidyltransferase
MLERDRLDKLLQELKAQLVRLYGDRLVDVILYGSMARGEATDQSDIDVLVVLGDQVLPIREIRRMADIRLHFLLEFGELVSIMPMSLAEFGDRSASFANHVRREGIAV